MVLNMFIAHQYLGWLTDIFWGTMAQLTTNQKIDQMCKFADGIGLWILRGILLGSWKILGSKIQSYWEFQQHSDPSNNYAAGKQSWNMVAHHKNGVDSWCMFPANHLVYLEQKRKPIWAYQYYPIIITPLIIFLQTNIVSIRFINHTVIIT